MLETFDTIYYTSLFLLGGYISQQIVENAYPSGDDTPSAKMLLRYLFFSLVIFTVSYPVILFLTSEFSETTKLEELLLSLIPLCFSSIIVGLARRKYVRYIMERGRSIIPLFSAWDRAFYSLTKAYLKVKLKSGSEIFGYLDSASFVSLSRHSDPDILFALYYVNNDGKWIKQENESILISRSNIEYIRIINIKEGKDAALVAEAERKKRS